MEYGSSLRRSHGTPEARSIGPLRPYAIACSALKLPMFWQRAMKISFFVSRSSMSFSPCCDWTSTSWTRCDEVVGHLPREPADAEVGVHQAVARDLLEDVLQVLALAERVREARAEEAGVDAERAHEHEVAAQPVQLGEDDADVLRPLRHLDVHQPLDREAVAEFGAELRQVLRAVAVADALAEVHRLHQLLAAAVHVADVRRHVDDLLAVDDEHHAEDAVRARVLRPHVDGHIDDFERGVALEHHRYSSPSPAPSRRLSPCHSSISCSGLSLRSGKWSVMSSGSSSGTRFG